MFDIDTDPEYTDVKSLVEMSRSEQAAWLGCRWKPWHGHFWRDQAVPADNTLQLGRDPAQDPHGTGPPRPGNALCISITSSGPQIAATFEWARISHFPAPVVNDGIDGPVPATPTLRRRIWRRNITTPRSALGRPATTAPDSGPAQRTPARRKARQLARTCAVNARLRLPQRGLPAPARRARCRVGRHREVTALCAHRGGDPPLLPDGVDTPALRRHLLIKTLLYTGVRVAELVAIRLTTSTSTPADPHHPRQGRQGPDVPFPASSRKPSPCTWPPPAPTAHVPVRVVMEKAVLHPRGPRHARPLRPQSRPGAQHPTPPAPPLPVHLAQTQGIDDALIQPYSGHASRTSLEIYSRLALPDAQASYDGVIGQFPV